MADRSVRLGLAQALALGAVLAAPASAHAEARRFVLDPQKSRVVVHVGKAGLFKFAGHEHEVVAPLQEGEVVADAVDLGRSSVRLVFDAASLRLDATHEPPDDAAKVQETLTGPAVLDAARFTRIVFQSDKVSGREIAKGVFELTVSGLMEIRGQKDRLSLTVRAEARGDTLVATGTAPLRQSAFGIVPVSVAGVVKVKDELLAEFRFEGRPAP
jgi:polyisoprenoid-binding protein YceI